MLCAKQGASGFADPELLESLIDSPTAHSTAHRQAFRRQKEQAVWSAAKRDGGGRGTGIRPQILAERS